LYKMDLQEDITVCKLRRDNADAVLIGERRRAKIIVKVGEQRQIDRQDTIYTPVSDDRQDTTGLYLIDQPLITEEGKVTFEPDWRQQRIRSRRCLRVQPDGRHRREQ